MTEKFLNRPEILAPAGNTEALEAALNAGCDAVYLGGSLFGARAYAGNFSEENLLKAIDRCHLFDVKVYMTVNTLFKENEIERLPEYLEPYYLQGLDAVLVQDSGAAKVIRDTFPGLLLHASTQMSISSSYGAELLKDLGFTRIVPARELTLEEIRRIKEKVDIEIETFVHGAMCFAYSGKCLFSSFAGGRSGNRGRCAQPCRQCYHLIGTESELDVRYANESEAKHAGRMTGHVKHAHMEGSHVISDRHKKNRADSKTDKYNNDIDIKKNNRNNRSMANINEHIMSLKDLCALGLLPELIESGIDSFKIEGRMKNSVYVAGVTNAYKMATETYLEMKDRFGSGIDGWNEDQKAKYHEFARKLTFDLRDIYNRGGFFEGYYKDKKGYGMLAADRPNHFGISVGKVDKVIPPNISIKLSEDINIGDVLEIRGFVNERTKTDACIAEITSNVSSTAGSVVSLKGKALSKIRSGMEVYRTRNNKLIGHIEEEVINVERQLEVYAYVRALKGEPLMISVSEVPFTDISNETMSDLKRQTDSDGIDDTNRKECRGIVTATVYGSIIESAEKQNTTAGQLVEKMGKTAGSGLLINTDVNIDEGVFVPMSEFNHLRREAMELIKKKKQAGYQRSKEELFHELYLNN